MQKKSNVRIGGFVAQNSGEIDNCYSVVKFKTQKSILGGFAGENLGDILHSFYNSGIKGLHGGVAGGGRGNTELSYFFHNEREKSKKLQKLRDKSLGIKIDDVKNAEHTEQFIENLGFDIGDIWEYINAPQILRFIPEKWLFDIRKSTLYPRYDKGTADYELMNNSGVGVLELKELFGEAAVAAHEQVEVTVIRTADELFELAKAINEGDRELRNAYIRLEKDIDLGGKEWEPIGNDLAKAFTGLFDGCGHTIKNFVVKKKETKAKGFFGYLKGEVYNLTVDCYIKGGNAAGGIAAYCEHGVIGYCASIIEMKCTKNESSFGGLVGSNTGRIFRSYSAGRISLIIIPWWQGLPLLLLPLLFLLPIDNPFSSPVFAPVPYDQDAVPVKDGLTPNTDGNFVSFQFEQYIDVSLETGLCKFNFVNPGNSNHDIVVQLHFTDAQAQRVMGSTGRSAEVQAQIESAPGYDPENYRTVIAESGSIRPGYGLNDLRVVSHANGAKLPSGDYNAVVYLIFYDIGTHNRAMLESQLPVVISVHD